MTIFFINSFLDILIDDLIGEKGAKRKVYPFEIS